MTTLPQSHPIRLPRPTGGQLAIPTPTAVMAPSFAPAGQMTAGDVWRVIRSNMWLILITVAVFAAGGFAVNMYLDKYHASYTGVGYARVTTLPELLGANDTSPDRIQMEQSTQSSMLLHDSLWLEVFQNPQSKIRQTKWWNSFQTPQREAKEDLKEHFSVVSMSSTRLLRISMQARDPVDTQIIVDEILGQHIRKQRSYTNAILLEKTKAPTQLLENYEREMASIQARIREKSKAIGDDIAGTSMVQFEITRLTEDRIRMQDQYDDAMQRLAYLQALNDSSGDPPQLLEAMQGSASVEEMRGQIMRLDTLLLDVEKQWGKEHPKAQALLRQRETLDKRFTDVKEELRATITTSLSASYRTSAERATQQSERIKAELEQKERLLSRIQAVRSEIGVLESQAFNIRTTMDRLNQQLNDLRSKITTGNGSAIEWAAPTQIPDKPTFPKLSSTMGMAIMMGLALALGIAFLRELTDTTVRSPRDIARVGQMNLLGMVPHQDDDPQSAGARLPMAIFDAPQSAIAEQFRQIRTRLQHAASLDTTRSLLITSASGGDGKTTVAANLAAGLALNGRHILLVDANFRRPELHNLFEIDNEKGFSDVLNSLDQFEGTVRETQVPNLSVLPAGPRPINPTELLESQLLIDFIERALEQFDHVIFDSGPLPLVSETVALAPRVDGVVTVVRARTNSRGLLQRVRDELRKVKAENLGVILNGVRSRVGGYYGRNILDYYEYQSESHQ